MNNKIVCDCGLTLIKKSNYNKHKKSKKHLERFNMLSVKNDEQEDDIKEETMTLEDTEIVNENETEIKANVDNEDIQASESAEEEEIEIKPISKKNEKSKEYMDSIRIKAIEKIRQKKQLQIDKENEIKKKAEQYDILVNQLKNKEEQEKKRKEEERVKEMEYKSREYDKMVKQQHRSQAISSMSNEKIINDIKEQRINYLMRYLNNPSMY